MKRTAGVRRMNEVRPNARRARLVPRSKMTDFSILGALGQSHTPKSGKVKVK